MRSASPDEAGDANSCAACDRVVHEDASAQDARSIDDQCIARSKKLWEITDRRVCDRSCRPLDHHESRRIARMRRFGRDERRIEVVIEFRRAHEFGRLGSPRPALTSFAA